MRAAPTPTPATGGLLRRLESALARRLRNRRAGLDGSVQRMPELAAPDTIVLTSTAFAHGGPIPDAHAGTGRGANRSPQLAWSGLPAGTAQLLLVMEDPDVPFSTPAVHLAALLPPEPAELAEDALRRGTPGIRFVPGLAGRVGYHGPRALAGHDVHRYDFHLFALDRPIPAEARLSKLAALRPLVAGHVLARGHLQGTQQA